MKEEIRIKGALLLPLQIGMPAYIREENGIRRTTAVAAVYARSRHSVMFKTQNTVYLLEIAKAETTTEKKLLV